jgi:hypothetical protein
MSNTAATRYFAAGIAAVALAFGAYMIGKSNTTSTPSANAAQQFAPPGAQSGQSGQSQGGQSGQLPQGTQNGQAPPGFGTEVTGATLARLKSVVTARYPGQVERAMKLQDGSYVVHVIGTSGETHVLVSKAFKITGTETGGPGGPGGGAPPSASGTQS